MSMAALMTQVTQTQPVPSMRAIWLPTWMVARQRRQVLGHLAFITRRLGVVMAPVPVAAGEQSRIPLLNVGGIP